MEKTNEKLTSTSTRQSSRGSEPGARIGFLHVYTGNGKGKTTAALGLMLRALGADLRVCLIQFAKRGEFSEIVAIRKAFPKVKVQQFGTGRFICGRPSPVDRRAARMALGAVIKAMGSGRYDVVIADEAITAVNISLLSSRDLLCLAAKRPSSVDLILTGRGAGKALIRAADLVTEMREVKHYYRTGIPARRGIEM